MKSTLVYLSFLLLLVHFVAIHADDDDSDSDSRSDSDSDSDSNSEEYGRKRCPKVKCQRESELVKNPHGGRCPYCRPIRLHSSSTRRWCDNNTKSSTSRTTATTHATCPPTTCSPCYKLVTRRGIKCPFCVIRKRCIGTTPCPTISCPVGYQSFDPAIGCPYCVTFTPTVTTTTTTTSPCPEVTCQPGYVRYDPPVGCSYCIKDTPTTTPTTTSPCPTPTCPPCYDIVVEEGVNNGCPFCTKLEYCPPGYHWYHPPEEPCPICVPATPRSSSSTSSPCPTITCQRGYIYYVPPVGCPQCIPDPSSTTPSTTSSCPTPTCEICYFPVVEDGVNDGCPFCKFDRDRCSTSYQPPSCAPVSCRSCETYVSDYHGCPYCANFPGCDSTTTTELPTSP